MKSSVIILVALFAFIFEAGAQQQVINADLKKDSIATKRGFPVKIGLSAKLHKAKKDCKLGFGICQVTITIAPAFTVVTGVLTETELEVVFNEELRPFFEDGEDLNVLEIEPDEVLELPEEVRAAFGYNFTILPGSYPVDYGTSRFGSVRLQIQLL